MSNAPSSSRVPVASSNKDRKSKVMLFASSAVLGVCLIWITLFTMRSCKPVAEAPRSAATLKAIDVSAKLHEEGFFDVGMDVLTESPLRFKVQGAVHSQKELSELKDALKRLHPDENYDFEVEILK